MTTPTAAMLEAVRTATLLDDVFEEDPTTAALEAHVAALDDRLRELQHRRAVLRAVANRESELEEVELMSKLASMSDEQRKRLVDEFWDEVTDGLDVDTEFYAWMRSAKPELPDDPSAEQLEAWIEFAELVSDAESDGVSFCSTESTDPGCANRQKVQDGFITAAAYAADPDGAWIQVGVLFCLKPMR